MDTSESNNDKILLARSPRRFTTYIILLIIVVQLLVAFIAYPFLPDIIPSHWNAAGQVNGYLPKIGVFLQPLISIGVYVLLRVLYAISPRLGSQDKRANWDVISMILVGVLLLLFVVHLTIIAIALHMPVDVPFVISLALSGLCIFMGNYLGKLRRNFWGGIRTPWTLASDFVWERTHRLGGWLFVLGGVLGIGISFIPFLRLFGIVAIILIVSLISVVYSYIVYQRSVANGEEPLSPPFDS